MYTLLLYMPLPCNLSAETALQPLIWCFVSQYSHWISSSSQKPASQRWANALVHGSGSPISKMSQRYRDVHGCVCGRMRIVLCLFSERRNMIAPSYASVHIIGSIDSISTGLGVSVSMLLRSSGPKTHAGPTACTWRRLCVNVSVAPGRERERGRRGESAPCAQAAPKP